MSKSHTGYPPSEGWWPCGLKGSKRPDCLRWFSRPKFWSWPAFANQSASFAAEAATYFAFASHSDIVWFDRPDDWPERSKT